LENNSPLSCLVKGNRDLRLEDADGHDRHLGWEAVAVSQSIEQSII